jgi:hypothetical protein
MFFLRLNFAFIYGSGFPFVSKKFDRFESLWAHSAFLVRLFTLDRRQKLDDNYFTNILVLEGLNTENFKRFPVFSFCAHVGINNKKLTETAPYYINIQKRLSVC